MKRLHKRRERRRAYRHNGEVLSHRQIDFLFMASVGRFLPAIYTARTLERRGFTVSGELTEKGREWLDWYQAHHTCSQCGIVAGVDFVKDSRNKVHCWECWMHKRGRRR